MARLRFPGRPGHRFDRISIRYFDDDVKNLSDPAIAFLPQFQRGLQLFRELVGESDEDDEFEGFSVEDLRSAEKKQKQYDQEEKKKSIESPEKTSPPPGLTLGTRLKSASQLLDNLPASERTRGRKKVVVRKSYKDIVTEGLVSPSKILEILKSKDVVSPEDKVHNQKQKSRKVKPTVFKLDEKYNVPGSHIKRTDNKDMAKFLLEKAKQAQKLTQQKREQRLNKKTPNIVKREFVLPTQSSRSSRVIKPNKRFLEDDSVHSVVKKKSKPEDLKSEQDSQTAVQKRTFSESHVGLLDQPLIQDGKRERKLSLKMKQKNTDFGAWESSEDASDFQLSPSFRPAKNVISPPHLVVTSPLAAPKFGSSFTKSGAQFQKASEQQRLGMMGLTRKPGMAIVQKAKLQLNRDALNESKAALARSLKAKMRKEAQQGGGGHKDDKITREIEGVPFIPPDKHYVAADGTPHLPAEAKKPRIKKQCPVCRSRINLVKSGMVFACTACVKFVWNMKKHIGVKEFICTGKGKCVFSPVNKTTCRACRMRKCLEGGLIREESSTRLMALFYQKYFVRERKGMKKDSLLSPQSKTPSEPLNIDTSPVPVLLVPNVGSDTMKLPVVTPLESETKRISDVQSEHIHESDNDDFQSPVKVRTLSGEIREHKRKKQKAFKELLRTKQERTENLLAIPDTPKTIPGQPSDDSPTKTSPHSPAKGPRIKHVCRNAAMVLGKTPARFPSVSEIRLSALPTKDKVQLWKQEEADKAAKGDSDDDRPLEEIIQHSTDSVQIMKKSPAYSAGNKEKKKPPLIVKKGYRMYKRTIRCRQCDGCKAECCGKCTYCLDMRKFGGPGTLKKACIKRVCSDPRKGRPATEAFLDLKDDTSGTDSNAGSAASSPRKPRPAGLIASKQSDTKVSEAQVNGGNTAPPVLSVVPLSSGSEVRRLDFGGSVPDFGGSVPDLEDHRLTMRSQSGKINSKRIKVDVYEKYAKKTAHTDGQFYPVSLQSVVPASKYWGTSLKTPHSYPIKVDFKGVLSINSLWKQGLALTLASSLCVRTVCFLCGSAGKEEMFYCNICCEPYHEFCLEDENFDASHLDDWVCTRCQFCHVCGRCNNLLRCDKCHDMYHPECLGPNYPTKPSKKKNIWICTKCVKCKSCGATTPGSAAYATWTYDFSLCYECGQLMDKGNFCPICRKCYSDDDWESKMVQCSMCESWVHAKCEGLSDEMYEILSYMPEDMSFNCRKCYPVGCPEWEMTLKRELRNGLENILNTLILSKSSQYIYKYEQKKSPKKLCDEVTSQNEIQERMETDSASSVQTDEKSAEKQEKSSEESSEKSSEKSCEVKDSNVALANERTVNDGCAVATQGKSQNDKNVTALTSTSEIKCENSEMSNDTGNNSESDSGRTTRSAMKNCDKTFNSVELSDLNTAKAVNHIGSEQTTHNTKTDDPNVEKDNPDNTGASTACGVPMIENIKVENDGCSDNNGCLVERSCDKESAPHNNITGSDSGVQISDSPANNIDHCIKEDSSAKQGDCEKEKDNSQIVPIKQKSSHVHFSDDQEEKKIPEPEHPKDLLEIQAKMKDGYYASVALFSEDIMRIIQVYLDDEEETRCTRKKAVNSARSVFVKQMEKVFPWYNIKTCRYWYSNKDFPRGMLPEATLPPTTDHTYAQWLEREQLPLSPQPSPFKKYSATPVKKTTFDDEDGEIHTQLVGEDTRKCLLCLKYGDQDSNTAGRLIYCGQDDWVHVNCALWSAEVYEDSDGSLQNLKEAYSRGKMLKCNLCQLAGATVGCNTPGCKANYHFMCAREDKCVLQVDKKVFCQDHTDHSDREILSEDRFSVQRRVFVKNLFVRMPKKAWANGLNSSSISVVIGSCTIECLGKLTDLSDRPRFLVPVNYMCTRVYWSTKDARRRCIYTCTVREVHPEALKSPTVPIKDMRIIHDETHPEYVPIEKLNLSEMGIDIAKQEADLSMPSDISVVDQTGTSYVDLTGCNEESTQMSINTSEETLSHVGPLSSSFGGRDSKKLSTSASLSESWPGAKAPEKQSSYSVDLTVLSPATQKLLNMTNLKKYEITESKPNMENDDCGLLKIANRLNRAAATCKARSRQSSEERALPLVPHGGRRSRSSSFDAQSIPRPFSPPPRIASPTAEGSMVTRPFSPPFRIRSRSPSVEKAASSPLPFISKVSGIDSGTARASSVDRVLPARPFSPPLRLPHRARSASLEKTCFSKSLLSSDTVAQLSENRKINIHVSNKIGSSSNKLASPSINMCVSPLSSHSSAVNDGRPIQGGNIETLSDQFVSPDPKPISASSPLEHKNKATKVSKTNAESDSTSFNISQSSATALCSSELENSSGETESMELSQKLEESVEMSQKLEGSMEMSQKLGDTLLEGVAVSENDDITEPGTDTVVIMTDSTDEITEEEAILIAQAAIEQSSSSDSHVLANDDESTCTDKIENSENEKENTEHTDVFVDAKCDTEIESAIKPIDSEIGESGVKSESPFIPKMIERSDDLFLVSESDESKIVDDAISSDKKTSDLNVDDGHLKVEGDHYQAGSAPHTPVLISTDSDSDSEIVDITASIVKGSNSAKVDSEIVDITASIVQGSHAVKVAGIDLESGRKSSTKDIVEKELDLIDSDIEILDSIGSGKKKLPSQETVINNFTETDGMPELERFDAAEGKSGDQIQPKDTQSEADEKVHEFGVETAQIINTDDEIDGSSTPIASLTAFADGFKTVDNSEKLHLISLPRSESSEALHVGIIEEIDSDTETISQPVITITPEKEGSSNSMDKNIFERMKQFSYTSSFEAEKDERSEEQKHEIMRGLGLERSEEVEKARKSPKNSPSPLKTYPLRKNMLSPLRYRDTDNVLGSGRKGKETKSPEEVEHGSLPVLDPIAKKIKMESLAKSSTDARGPFRCDTCKRSYRTEASLHLHREKCDFEVSTSEEDDSESQLDQSVSRRTRRKIHKRASGSPEPVGNRSSLRRSTMVQRVALEVEMKRLQEENVPKKRGRPTLSTDPRATPGRSGNLIASRFSARKGLQHAETIKVVTQKFARGRGTPRKFGINSSKNYSPEKCRRGRPSKNEVDSLRTSVKSFTKNLKSREKLASQKQQSSLLMNARNLLRQKLLSKRGRPRKYKDSDSEEMPTLTKTENDEAVSVDEKTAPKYEVDGSEGHSQQPHSKYSLRHTRRSGICNNSSDEMPVLEKSPPGTSNRSTVSIAEEPPVLTKLSDHEQTGEASNLVCKRGRGRPPKHVSDESGSSKDAVKDIVHSSSTTGQKRDLPSLRKEVENFRKIKKLKRDSSQESADVIEIDSSDDENTSNRINAGMINRDSVAEKGFNDMESKMNNPGNSKFENKDDITSSETIKALLEFNEQITNASKGMNKVGDPNVSKTIEDKPKPVETDIRVYCDDSIVTNAGDAEHKKSRLNTANNLGIDNVDNSKMGQTHGNDLVAKHVEVEHKAQCLQNQESLKIKELHGMQNDKKSEDITGVGNKDQNLIENEESENIVLGDSEVPGSEKSSLSASRSGQLKGGQGGEESDSVASTSSLSNTVLKLLKEGHKVLIKNPKVGKSFLWEKTEKGYVGRPYEKDVKGQASGEKNTKGRSSEPVPHTTATVTTCSATIISSNAQLEDSATSMKEDSMTKLKPFSGPSSTTSSLQELQKINARIIEPAKPKTAIQIAESTIQKAPDSKIRQSTASQMLFSYYGKNKGMQQQSATPTSMSIAAVTQPPSQPANSTISTLPKLSPIQSVPSIASIARSSVSPQFIGLPTQQTGLPIQQTGLLTQQTGLPTQQTGLPIQQSGLQSQQTGLKGLPVSNMMPNVNAPKLSPQIGISQTVVTQSVNFSMANQSLNTVQSSYPSQLAINQPLTIQPSPQESTYKPIIVRQVPYANQVGVPVVAQVGMLTGPVVQQVRNSQNVLQPVLRSTLTQPLGIPSVVVSPVSSAVSSTTRSMVSEYLSKKSETVSNNITDSVKFLHQQPNVQFSHHSGSVNIAGSAYPYSDALKATASLTNANSIESRKRDLDRQVYDTMKAQSEREPVLFNKMRDFYGKKHITPKSTTFLKKHPVYKSVFGNKEHKYGLPESHMKLSKAMPKGHSLAENKVFPKRPYRKRLGNKSPLKKKVGGPKAGRPHAYQKKTKIEGPHSLGSSSHPIIHGPKEISSLPAAALEEEVVEIPLDAMYDQLDSQQQGGRKNKENQGHLEFEITSDDGFKCKSDTIDGAWRQVIDRVQDARAANRLKQLSYGGLNGLSLSGLSHSNTVYLVEQLYGAGYCQTYKFRYHSHELRRHEEPPANPSGCIRTEPFDGRKSYDMFSFLMSRYRARPEPGTGTEDIEMMQKSSRRATSMDLPMAMRFRKLKEHSREACGVYRSRIHGRGLFCKRSIDAGEMIIEYAGEVIRTSLTDVREKYYESKGIGCYMFRIDDTDVVDATMKGSAARFINHSCEPNCYSKVINVDNRKHIVIFAIRQIQRGEELTYDYKFPIEDVKILCTCGSRRCRKYLN